jgi:hypothetical protein
MRLSLFALAGLAAARATRRSEDQGLALHKRAEFNISGSPYGDPQELQKRDGTKYVFMHHVRVHYKSPSLTDHL